MRSWEGGGDNLGGEINYADNYSEKWYGLEGGLHPVSEKKRKRKKLGKNDPIIYGYIDCLNFKL